MLSLATPAITVEGITIFGDHADKNQYWYLPGPIQLARRREDRRHALTFIKYKPAAVSSGAKGGGFLMFETELTLDSVLERMIRSRLGSIAKGRPRLAAVPFESGSVQCIALNLQGQGGTTADRVPEGAFNAVESILGASTPSLDARNTAAFSLTLSQEGATIVEQAFQEGTTPIGVIYDLRYSALRPALHVKITADLDRVYTGLSGGISAQIYFVQAGIEAAFERLKQEGAIKIEVIDFSSAEDRQQKEEWALNFFKQDLLREWFTPTLNPGQVAGGIAQPESLDRVRQRGDALRPPQTPAPPRPGPPAAVPAAPTTPAQPAAASTPSPSQGSGHPAPPRRAAPAPGQDVSPAAGTGSPPGSSSVMPVAGAGLRLPPEQLRGAGTPDSVSATASGGTAVVAFKLRFVRQEERKHLELEYNRAEAVERTYAPQGFFGLLVADLDRQNHFIEVDLDDPFFRTFAVEVQMPIDFDQIGLISAHLTLDYGDPRDPTNHRHSDFVFEKDNRENRRWEVFVNKNFDTDYRYFVQYFFDPQTDWIGETFSYELPAIRTEDRTLLLNPYEHLGFLRVKVYENEVDWGAVNSIDVHLSYQDSGGWSTKKTYTLKSGSASATWRLRLGRKDERDYTYRLVHHLKDGTTREIGPITTRAAEFPIDDCYEGALDLEFWPMFDEATTRVVLVDVDYEDEENRYRREERLQLRPGGFDPRTLRISLLDPTKRTFRYRLTHIGTNNEVRRDLPVETEDFRVFIS